MITKEESDTELKKFARICRRRYNSYASRFGEGFRDSESNKVLLDTFFEIYKHQSNYDLGKVYNGDFGNTEPKNRIRNLTASATYELEAGQYLKAAQTCLKIALCKGIDMIDSEAVVAERVDAKQAFVDSLPDDIDYAALMRGEGRLSVEMFEGYDGGKFEWFLAAAGARDNTD